MNLRPLLFGLLALSIIPADAIDVTPRWIDTTIDGIVQHRLFFADGEKKILIQIDRETEVSSALGGTTFRFPKFPKIDFIVAPSKHSPADPFEGVKLAEYRKTAGSLLPSGATAAEIREEVLNPIAINNWRSFRVLLRFTKGGHPWLQTVTFVNVSERDQIALVTAAPVSQWEEADTRSWQIIRSWQEMLPGDEAPPSTN